MRKLPLSKQVTFVGIVAGVAILTSFLLAFITSALAGRSGQPLPSPLIGLSFGAAAGAVYLGLARNRHVPIADDTARRAALMPVVDGTAQLIVFRQGFAGKLAGIDVLVDGGACAQLKSPRFIALALAPGMHEVGAQLQGKVATPLTVNLAANETAMVRLAPGLMGPKLTREADVAALRRMLAGVPMVVA